MVLGDVSLTAQEKEGFWLANGWAKPGSAAGHQPDFWLGADGPRENVVCLITVLGARQDSPNEDQLWGSASWWREVSAQSWTDSPAHCHEAPSGQKSLCAHLPNQTPIKDHPAAHYLLLCRLFCPTSIMKPQIRSAQCAISIKQKRENFSFSYTSYFKCVFEGESFL